MVLRDSIIVIITPPYLMPPRSLLLADFVPSDLEAETPTELLSLKKVTHLYRNLNINSIRPLRESFYTFFYLVNAAFKIVVCPLRMI